MKDWSISNVAPKSNGFDIIVKLTGESILGTKLWVKMNFEFRDGELTDLNVADHNAVFVEPFAMTQALFGLAAELTEEIPKKPTYTEKVDYSYETTKYEPYVATSSIKFRNTCKYPAKLWVRYQDKNNDWVTNCIWSFEGNKSSFLSESVNRIQLSSPIVYYYAEIPDKDYSWHGEVSAIYRNTPLSMRKHVLSRTSEGNYSFGINCDNFTQVVPKESTSNSSLVIGVVGQDLESYGNLRNVVQVTGIVNGLPAFKSGIKRGDIITEINGKSEVSMENLRQSVHEHDNKYLNIKFIRNYRKYSVTLVPEVLPTRKPLNLEKCRKEGNPNDYYLGAIAAPYTENGVYKLPTHPFAKGKLFQSLKELDVYVFLKEPYNAFIFYSKDIRTDIKEFIYRDMDRTLFAKLESGEYLDLGIRISCQVQFGISKATQIRLSKTKDGNEISHKMIPLFHSN